MQRPASLKNSAKQKLNRFESISLFLFQTEQIMAGPIVEFSAHGQLEKWESPTTDWVRVVDLLVQLILLTVRAPS